MKIFLENGVVLFVSHEELSQLQAGEEVRIVFFGFLRDVCILIIKDRVVRVRTTFHGCQNVSLPKMEVA